MTFPRQYPVGAPFRGAFTSAIATNWDTFINEAVDGTAGGSYSGAITLSNVSLTGTSSINTTGTVACGNTTITGTLSVSSTCGLGGTTTCTGSFSATYVTGLTCVNGSLVEMQSGSTLRLDSGSLLVGLAGSSIQTAGAMEISSGGSFAVDAGGTFALGAGVAFSYSTPATVTRRGLRLIGSTVSGGTTDQSTSYVASKDAWVGPSASSPNGNVVVTLALTSYANEAYYMEIPGLIHGATLTQIQATSIAGGLTTTPTGWPVYSPERIDQAGNISQLYSGGTQIDTHSGGSPAWTSAAATTVTCNQNNVIDLATYTYRLKVLPPVAPSGGGAQMFLRPLVTVQTVPALPTGGGGGV